MREQSPILGPTLVIIQGKLKPGAGEAYKKYLVGSQPLTKKYGAEVSLVGSGLESDVTTEVWPINAVWSSPTEFSRRSSRGGVLADSARMQGLRVASNAPGISLQLISSASE